MGLVMAPYARVENSTTVSVADIRLLLDLSSDVPSGS